MHKCISPTLSAYTIEHAFGHPFCYKFTLNPNWDKEVEIRKLFRYFDKKGYTYWLMMCRSPSGFLHFHGMLRIILKNDKEVVYDIKKRIYNQININVGRKVDLEPTDSIKAWYYYIHGESNLCQEEFHNIKFDGIKIEKIIYELD